MTNEEAARKMMLVGVSAETASDFAPTFASMAKAGEELIVALMKKGVSLEVARIRVADAFKLGFEDVDAGMREFRALAREALGTPSA